MSNVYAASATRFTSRKPGYNSSTQLITIGVHEILFSVLVSIKRISSGFHEKKTVFQFWFPCQNMFYCSSFNEKYVFQFWFPLKIRFTVLVSMKYVFQFWFPCNTFLVLVFMKLLDSLAAALLVVLIRCQGSWIEAVSIPRGLPCANLESRLGALASAPFLWILNSVTNHSCISWAPVEIRLPAVPPWLDACS